MHGARIVEKVRVTGFRISRGRITHVETTLGLIACEKVVNCAGTVGAASGCALAGINVPLQPVKHQYIITDKIPASAPTPPPSAILTAAPITRKRSRARHGRL